MAGQRAQSAEEKDEAAEALVAVVAKEIEPLFTWDKSAGPYFGGNERLTLAEVSHLLHLLLPSESAAVRFGR